MVNTGKPSKGCYMCRSRRIKCDEGKPGCLRCQKSKRICPGYRDAFELNLRDETKSTKQKMSRMINHRSFVDGVGQFDQLNEPGIASLALTPISIPNTNIYAGPSLPWTTTTKCHSAKNSLGSISSTSSNSSTGSVHSHSGLKCISPHLSTPIDQQATCFFLANFVLLPGQGVMRGYLDFLLPLLQRKNGNHALLASFSAVALAALGTRPNSKSLLPQAELSYMNALKKINSTLRDSKLATSDSTLAAVLLLSFFEQVTAPRLNHQAWSSHVDGATAVLKARGPDDFQTPLGREMWHTVRALMTVQCIANSRAIEPGVDWWMSVPPKDDVINGFASLNLKVANLRADNNKTTTVEARTTTNMERVLKLLRTAEDLEREYVRWFESLPATWETKSVAWFEDETIDLANSLVHPGRVDSYSEVWIAYHYNIARSSRIFIWTTILRCVAWLGEPSGYRLSPEYVTASQVCGQLIEDIVASVPFFFSWNKDKDEEMADKSCFACGTNEQSTVKSIWGIFVMWPLFAAASSDFAMPSQRVFLRGRLKHISESMGIYQATVLLKAPLIHPSVYIERERRNMEPQTCRSQDTQIEFKQGTAQTTITLPPLVPEYNPVPLPQTSTSIPVEQNHWNLFDYVDSEDRGLGTGIGNGNDGSMNGMDSFQGLVDFAAV